ncbi:hypothetical protein ACO1O0_004317 [Amphichorda felina]
MAGKIDASEQVKFLLSCIRNTNNGRPDFSAVATELSIVSKAAAQKRYERMLKAHNAAAANPPSPTDTEATPNKNSASRKRGAGDAASDEPPVKKRGRAPLKSKAVKKESDDEENAKPVKASNKKKTQKVKNEDEDSGLSDIPSDMNLTEAEI